MTRALNIWFAAGALVIALMSAEPARAEGEKRVVVMEFDGPGAASVRNHVVQALGDRSEVDVVAVREAENAANRLGISLESSDDYQKLGRELKVSAFVEGKIQKEGKNVRAVISVRNAATGEVVHEEPWTRKKVAQLKAIRGNFWEVMGPHILASSAPESEAAEPVAETEGPRPVARPSDEEEPSEQEPEQAGPEGESYAHPALTLWVGPRLMWRTLSYDGNTGLSSYKNEAGSPAFNMALGAQWYPGAHFRDDWLSNIGLDADFDYSIGLKSDQMGKELTTTAYELNAGAIFRLPLDGFEPRFRLGYLKQVFDVEVPATTPLPAVSYSAVRFGAGTAVNLVPSFSFDVAFAGLFVLDTGEIGSAKFASKASAFGFEAGGGITTRFKEAFGFRLGIDYRRYNYDFGGSQNATLAIPKGGSDDYLRVTIAFLYSLPGASAEPSASN